MDHDLVGSFCYLKTAAILPNRRDALLRRVSPAAKICMASLATSVAVAGT